MTSAEQSGYRVRVNPIPDGIELHIPAKRSAVMATLVVLWLCGWTWGMIEPASGWFSPIDGAGSALFRWFMWTLGEIIGIAMLLWTLSGGEHIYLAGQTLTIRRRVCGLSFDTNFDIPTIAALRVVADDDRDLSNFSLLALFSGPLAFGYRTKTVSFGAGIEKVEAHYVLSRIVAAKPTLDFLRNPSS